MNEQIHRATRLPESGRSGKEAGPRAQPVSRRQFLRTTAALAAWTALEGGRMAAAEPATDFRFQPDKEIIPAPSDPAQWPEFRRRLEAWREAKRHELNYTDALYRRADFAWVATSFSCCFLMMCDETFYNPWDTGTRREGQADLDVLCELVRELEVDGIFLDTMSQGAAEFRAKLDALRLGVALEGEAALALNRVHDHHLSWAQWFVDGEVPGVLRNKWFEPHHLQHQIRRWDYDHTGELQTAWMNGSGMMVWENVPRATHSQVPCQGEESEALWLRRRRHWEAVLPGSCVVRSSWPPATAKTRRFLPEPPG